MPAATVLVLLAFVAAGAFSVEIEKSRNAAPDRIRNIYDSGQIESGTPVEVEGVLTGQPEAAFDGEFLTLRTERLRWKGADRQITGNLRYSRSRTIRDLRSQI